MLIKETVSLQIYYYIPDHVSLINEFMWQTEDIIPELPRINQFLVFWKENIDAVIKEILISHAYVTKWNNIAKEIKWYEV